MALRGKRRQGDSLDHDAPVFIGVCFRCRKPIRTDQQIYDPTKLGLSVSLFGSDTFDSIDCLYSSAVDVSGGSDNGLATLLRSAISRTYPNHSCLRYITKPTIINAPIVTALEEPPKPRYSLTPATNP